MKLFVTHNTSKLCVTTQLPTNCKSCSSENLEIREGAGPHAAKVVCGDCGSFQKWLSRSLVEQLRDGGLI